MIGGSRGGSDTTQLLLRCIGPLVAIKAPLESLWSTPLAAGLREPRRGGPQTGTPLALASTGRELAEPRLCEPQAQAPLASDGRVPEPRRCGLQAPLPSIGREIETRRCRPGLRVASIGRA